MRKTIQNNLLLLIAIMFLIPSTNFSQAKRKANKDTKIWRYYLSLFL